MTVEELIEQLKQMPPDAEVKSIDAGCCGCALCNKVEVTLNADGCVAVTAHRYA
jgi:hypothetical protein